MGLEDVVVCLRHPGDVRLRLRTLHSDLSAPGQVIGVYVCPECDHERRLPIDVDRGSVSGGSDELAATGA
jgi:hypothetical protein